MRETDRKAREKYLERAIIKKLAFTKVYFKNVKQTFSSFLVQYFFSISVENHQKPFAVTLFTAVTNAPVLVRKSLSAFILSTETVFFSGND